MKIKTHTHNKTTKLRKFLLMKHNRNNPKVSTQPRTIILSDFKVKSISISDHVLIFIQTGKSAIKTDAKIWFNDVQLRRLNLGINSNKMITQTIGFGRISLIKITELWQRRSKKKMLKTVLEYIDVHLNY